jgi:hypothetical protein
VPAPHSDDGPSDADTGSREAAGGGGGEDRLRLVDVRTERDASSGLAVSVELEWEGRAHTGAARGVGSSTVEIRLGAEATLEALCACTEDPDFARLVGVKTVHAFDSEVILVSVRCRAAPGRNLVGAVPVEGRDRTRTAAAAVLDAVTRVAGPALAG